MFSYGFACASRFGVFPAFTVGIFAITPSATLPPRFGSVHMKEHVKPTKGGPKLFHPSTRVAEEHAKLPLRIRDKVKIYLFL